MSESDQKNLTAVSISMKIKKMKKRIYSITLYIKFEQ